MLDDRTLPYSSGSRRIVKLLPLLLVMLFPIVGCQEEVSAPQQGVTDASATRSGVLDAHEELARYLAVALNNTAVRNGLSQAMTASSDAEGKIFFDSTLPGPISGLVAQMAQAGNVSEEHIRALMESTPDLELYMPVDHHRANWKAGSEYLVVTEINEGAVPYAVNPEGEAVSVSSEQPPAKPTFSLVPAESFSSNGTLYARESTTAAGSGVSADMVEPCSVDDGVSTSCGGGGGGGGGSGTDWSSYPDGLYMTRTYFEDDGEGWPRGDPELEVIASVHENNDLGAPIRCTGEKIDADEYWNQDNSEWSGKARIATLTQLDNAPPSGEGIQFLVVEDDSDPCTLKFERPQFEIADAIYLADQYANGYDAWERDTSYPTAVEIAIDILDGLWNESDDIVGFILEDSCSSPSYSYGWDAKVLDYESGSLTNNGCVSFHLDNE